MTHARRASTTRAIGVDLGGTNLRVAIVDLAAGALTAAERRYAVGDAPEAAHVAELVSRVVAELVHDDPAAAGTPIGVGVAGMLRGETGVIANAPNLGWRDVDFGALLARQLPGCPIALANDVNAITYGELRFGAGRGATDLVCAYLGTGLGGGLVAGGRLVLGASHAAGELGHVRVVVGPDARPCGCGQHGCVEAYVGGRWIAARVADDLRRGVTTTIREQLPDGPGSVHAGLVDAAAASGDPYASALWDEVAPLLGLVLANAVTTLNPGRLVLGGTVWWGCPALRVRTLSAYRTLVSAVAAQACTIGDAVLGDAAGILGAAALAAGR